MNPPAPLPFTFGRCDLAAFRRWAFLTFNCNQLLHSLGIIVREKPAEPTQIVFDIPCAVGTQAQAQP